MLVDIHMIKEHIGVTNMSDKPRGYFEFLLGIDCETTGICFQNYDNNENPVFNPTTGERHQALSWGVMVLDASTFKPVEEPIYLEVKWNNNSIRQRKMNSSFGKPAEKVHGLSYEYLEQNGMEEEEAVVTIGEMILKYFASSPVKLLGHNVHLFDKEFLADMFKRYEVDISFGNRHYDSASLGFGTVGAWTSDDLFKTFGFNERKDHNALEDIRMTAEVFRLTKLLWKNKVGLISK